MQFGNPLVAGQQFSPGQLDLLGGFATNTPGTTFSFGNLAAINPYTALLVLATTGNASRLLSAYAAWNATLAFVAPAKKLLNLTGEYQCIIPVAGNASGDTYNVNCVFDSPWLSLNCFLYGITGERPVSVRPDGRAYPLGGFSARNFQAAAGTYPVVAAPTNGLRIFVRQVTAWGNNFVDVTGTCEGVNAELAAVGVAGGQVVSDFESGILLDTNTVLNMAIGGSCGAGVVYDLVF